MRRWTPDEDKVAIDKTLTLDQRAQILDRSRVAVSRRCTSLLGCEIKDWTAEEDGLLHSLHPDLDEICRRLPHRSRAAIIKRAGRIGVPTFVRVWTTGHIQFLRSNTHLTDVEIGRQLGRTAGAVLRARLAYGVPKALPPTWTADPLLVDVRKLVDASALNHAEAVRRAGASRGTLKSRQRRINSSGLIKVAELVGGEVYAVWDD
jgi:hypothetical protein